MPPADSTALIVARYLKSNHYVESYNAFISEVGLPANAGDLRKGDLTLETLLEEKKTFDLSVQFEKLGTADGSSGWRQPAPREEHAVTSLPSRSNLLSASVETFLEEGNVSKPVLLATSADRRLHILEIPRCELRESLPALQDSPILCCAVLQQRILLTTSMSGQVVASDVQGNVLDNRRDHSKYAVKVVVYHHRDEALIATAGWDSKIFIYKPTAVSNSHFQLGNPISTISLPTKPESLLFLTHPETSAPILLISRTDSSHIFFYTATEPTPRLLGKQNLAPHSNAWVAFTPSSLAICPTDPTLLAVGTNTVPHMKLLILRLLIPPYNDENTPASTTNSHPTTATRTSLLDGPPPPTAAAAAGGGGGEVRAGRETQASQARAALAIAETEASAIQIHCTTLAPQTPFSTPAVAWRPDGSGVWVNGDDGAVRGIEASTGKVVVTLRGHEEGSKVRCLWAGRVRGDSGGEEEGEEWTVSGGFDQKLVVWKTQAKD